MNVLSLLTQNWGWLYNYPPWIQWLILVGLLLVVIVVCSVFVFYFKDPHESAKVPTIVSIVGLVTIFFSLVLIPVDIFNVSHTMNPKQQSIAITILYYANYLFLLVFAFLVIPFAYFFYEEGDEENTTLKSRIWGATKYTIFSGIIGVLIMILALVLGFGESSYSDDKVKWIRDILDTDNYGKRAFGFIFACLALVGLIPWNIYTAYGLAALPIGLIKGRKKIDTEIGDVEEDLDITTESIQNINRKYELRGGKMSRKDRVELQRLKAKQRILRKKTKTLDQMSKSWAVRCEPFIYPFKLICGILLGLAILFVMVSLIISLIDRIIYSDCSIGCGFAIKKPVLPNPLDLLLTWSSSVFPVDYIVFLSFISLIVAGTLTGLANIGIKFFWIHLYQLKWRNTVPQGLLTSCIFMMMIVTVFSFTMVFFAPQYTSFGSQHFQNEQGEWQLCDFDHLYNATKAATLDYGMLNTTDPNPRTKGCFSTELVALVNSNFLRGRGYGQVFAVAFYFSNWVFILSFVISTIIALIRKPASFVKMEEDSDDDE